METHRSIFISEAWKRYRHWAPSHLKCLAAYVRNHILPERLPAYGDQVGHTPAAAVLHYNPKLGAVLKALLWIRIKIDVERIVNTRKSGVWMPIIFR